MILLKYTSHHAHLQAIILDIKRSCLNKGRQRNNVNKYYLFMFKVFSKIEFNHYKNERNFSVNLPKSMHLLTNKPENIIETGTLTRQNLCN
jgi:hypothetical protein